MNLCVLVPQWHFYIFWFLEQTQIQNFITLDWVEQILKRTYLFEYRIGKLWGASEITSSNEPKLAIVVRLVSIDQVIPSIRKVSIIQQDVKGYEKQALVGALHTIQHDKPLIIIEDHNDIINTEWFKRNILSLGYKLIGTLHKNHIISFILE